MALGALWKHLMEQSKASCHTTKESLLSCLVEGDEDKLNSRSQVGRIFELCSDVHSGFFKVQST